MTTFIPVRYHKRLYPTPIVGIVDELAGHFGKDSIQDAERYSLHTEYSFTKRNLSDDFSEKYPILAQSSYRGIPELWTSNQWAEEFGDFVIDLTSGKKDPEVIEVHPPFRDKCNSVNTFLDRYMLFKKRVAARYPKTVICLENRAGSQNTKSSFLISTIKDICELLSCIEERKCNLKVAVDYPQLFTAYGKEPKDVLMDWFEKEHDCLSDHKGLISSIHLWGKKRNEKGRMVAHTGDLNTLFDTDEDKKDRLLALISSFYDDGLCRYFVPEVNSNDKDLESIIKDCTKFGISFTGEFYIDK